MMMMLKARDRIHKQLLSLYNILFFFLKELVASKNRMVVSTSVTFAFIYDSKKRNLCLNFNHMHWPAQIKVVF